MTQATLERIDTLNTLNNTQGNTNWIGVLSEFKQSAKELRLQSPPGAGEPSSVGQETSEAFVKTKEENWGYGELQGKPIPENGGYFDWAQAKPAGKDSLWIPDFKANLAQTLANPELKNAMVDDLVDSCVGQETPEAFVRTNEENWGYGELQGQPVSEHGGYFSWALAKPADQDSPWIPDFKANLAQTLANPELTKALVEDIVEDLVDASLNRKGVVERESLMPNLTEWVAKASNA